MRAIVLTSLVAMLAVAGCSAAEDEAFGVARQACTLPAPSVPNYDPETTRVALLAELAEVAGKRADLSAEAAALDERWATLSEASNVLAVAAERIHEIRREGGDVAVEVTTEMWNQIKYASDAFVVECRPVIG